MKKAIRKPVRPFNIKLKKYDMELARAMVMKQLLKDHPSLTVVEYAEILNISERTFYRYLYEYKLPIVLRGLKRTYDIPNRKPNKLFRVKPTQRFITCALAAKNSDYTKYYLYEKGGLIKDIYVKEKGKYYLVEGGGTRVIDTETLSPK